MMKILRSAFLFAGLICALCCLPLTIHAQAAGSPTVTTVVVAAPPWYLSETLWATVIAFVSGVIAIWKNNAASTHQKINDALVLGIEQATQIPEVAAFESKIKSTIQAKATALGVQPILHRIVQDLTEPAATATTAPASQPPATAT